ncbi:MAG: GAF domain-containing protein [Anaerolineaceae bacterium]|nr:GAF domain-containing protein [Anaerolineaceae bacterium]
MDTEREATDSVAFNSLESQLARLIGIAENMQSFLQRSRSAVNPPLVYEGVSKLMVTLPQFHKQVITLEEERKSYRALSQIGQIVNSSLDTDVVLQTVMDTIIRLTGAERGFLMLREDNELVVRIARNWEQVSLDKSEFATSRTVINKVVNEGKAILTTNAQEDPRFTGQESVIIHNLRSILCAPLKVKGELTGVVYADNRIRSGLFTYKELELLSAFANQAAVAIENARLFVSVRKTLDEVSELKSLMDNVFASIASGVLTADVEERVTLCNRAAEEILGRPSKDLIGLALGNVLQPIISVLEPYMARVVESDEQITGLEASLDSPKKGKVDLRFSLSPLKDISDNKQGVAIVMEDLTERKHLEAQRRLFERMVSPAVIKQLNPDKLQLGGQRRRITIFFADIRGYTTFSEKVRPEELVSVLNRYLAAATEAILAEEGTIDKFAGDAVMAWFNAPIPQSDHIMRAVRSAIILRESLDRLHRHVPVNLRLAFGVGIHSGDAILGLVGTEKRLDYTAIGDCVNTAKRIQENSAPGQILISETSFLEVSEQIIATSHEPFKAKGKKDLINVYEVLDLK